MGSWFDRWVEKKFSKLCTETAYVAARKEGCECSAVFLLSSGKEVELQVPGEVVETLKPGQKGMLTRKGSSFVSFEREG